MTVRPNINYTFIKKTTNIRIYEYEQRVYQTRESLPLLSEQQRVEFPVPSSKVRHYNAVKRL